MPKKLTDIAESILRKKYYRDGEDWEKLCKRVVSYLASGDEEKEKKYFKVLYDTKFILNTPALMNAGTSRNSMSACFILPLFDSLDSIMETLKNSALIFQSGGGVGYDFSELRPKGDKLSKGGTSSGSVSFIHMFDTMSDVVKSAGKRRGASIGVLRVDHPDIRDFIKSKLDGSLQNFNISVAITDKFMDALLNGKEYDLINPRNGEVVKKENAKEIFNLICASAWQCGDPGLIFIDRVNRSNPVPHLGEIRSPNPCLVKGTMLWDGDKYVEIEKGGKIFKSWFTGNKHVIEIVLENGYRLKCTPDHKIMLGDGIFIQAKDTLDRVVKCFNNELSRVVDIIDNGEVSPVYDFEMLVGNPYNSANGIIVHNCSEFFAIPFASCILGSIDVAKFVKDEKIDYDALEDVVRIGVNMLNDVIDKNEYPMKEIEETTKAIRPIGLGIMGFANALIKMKIRYDSNDALKVAEELMQFITDVAWDESNKLGKEFGVYEAYKPNPNVKGETPRNCQTTLIAPTGTISIFADTSGGIEPLYAVAFKRNINDTTYIQTNELLKKMLLERGIEIENLDERIIKNGGIISNIKEIPKDIRDLFRTALEISPEWHVKMLSAFTKHIDNSASKTTNMPHDATIDDVKDIFMKAYELGCKSITVYRDGCKSNQPMETKKNRVRRRKEVLSGKTYEIKSGCTDLFITVNKDEMGISEIFISSDGRGGCMAQSTGLGIGMSLALQECDTPQQRERIIKRWIKKLSAVKCPVAMNKKGVKVNSCPHAIVSAIKMSLQDDGRDAEVYGDACPNCGMPTMAHTGGCIVCTSCGYSVCK